MRFGENLGWSFWVVILLFCANVLIVSRLQHVIFIFFIIKLPPDKIPLVMNFVSVHCRKLSMICRVVCSSQEGEEVSVGIIDILSYFEI